MRVKKVVKTICKRDHQVYEPGRAGLKLCLHLNRIDKQLHAKILVKLCFSFRFSQPAHGVDVVCLQPIKVIFGLGVECAEDSVSVGHAIDMGNTPSVPEDSDSLSGGFPAGDLFIGKQGCRRARFCQVAVILPAANERNTEQCDCNKVVYRHNRLRLSDFR